MESGRGGIKGRDLRMMKSDENKKSVPAHSFPECPNCGSEHAVRIGDTIVPDYCDTKASGIFRCGHCRNEYEFLKPEQPKVFSPKAQCPACGSYSTAAVKTGKVYRYHVCLSQRCLRSFKTVRPPNERQSRLSNSN